MDKFSVNNARLCHDVITQVLAKECDHLTCLPDFEQVVTKLYALATKGSIYTDCMRFQFDNYTYCRLVRSYILYDSGKQKFNPKSYKTTNQGSVIGEIDATNIPEFTLVVDLDPDVDHSSYMACVDEISNFMKHNEHVGYPIVRYQPYINFGGHQLIVDFPAVSLEESFEAAVAFGKKLDEIFRSKFTEGYASGNNDRYLRVYPGVFLGLGVFRPTPPQMYGSSEQQKWDRCSLYYKPDDKLELTGDTIEDFKNIVTKSVGAMVMGHPDVKFDIVETHCMPTYICNGVALGYYDFSQIFGQTTSIKLPEKVEPMLPDAPEPKLPERAES